MTDSPATKPSSVDEATDVIRDKILDLSLPPGKSINSQWLAKTLKLSRTPIREALNRLAAEGLIHFEANHGVFVHPLEVAEISQLIEAYRVSERIYAFYCDFSDPDLLPDVVDMQGKQLVALREHRFLDASYWNQRFRSRIAETSGNHHLFAFNHRMLNHARRLSCLIYSMEARDSEYYESQLTLLEGLHKDIRQAIESADRERLQAVFAHQVTIMQKRIADILWRRSEVEVPLGDMSD